MSGAKRTPFSGFRGNPLKDLGGLKAFGTLIGGGEGPDGPTPAPLPAAPAPAPTLVPGREEDAAKKRARRRGRTGRQSTIRSGRLASNLSNILNTSLG